MQFVYYIVYPLFYLIGLLPDWVHRVMSRMICFFLYRVVRYRLGVVRDNLKQAFIEKSDQQLQEIERKFYAHLSDIFVDTITLASISESNIRRRMEFINAHQIERYTAHRSWISAMAHYGSWELTISWGLHSVGHKVYAVYHPLRSGWADKYYRYVRGRFGAFPLATSDVGRAIIGHRQSNSPLVLAMIADQSPVPIRRWFTFLGRPTPFFDGIERMALKDHLPVTFLHIDKFDSRCYKGWFEVIYDGDEQVAPGEITRRYVEKLQEMIIRRPELWMWSHRRWKRSPRVEGQ